MSFSSKKRSHSTGRVDLSTSEQIFQNVHQSSVNNTGILPTINPGMTTNTNHNSPTKNSQNTLARPKLLQYIEENIIGKDHIFQGPWGLRRSMI